MLPPHRHSPLAAIEEQARAFQRTRLILSNLRLGVGAEAGVLSGASVPLEHSALTPISFRYASFGARAIMALIHEGWVVASEKVNSPEHWRERAEEVRALVARQSSRTWSA